MSESSEITAILSEARQGEAQALERLIPIVYGELRRLANYCMQQERSDHTLQPTALVHEAYIRLVGRASLDLRDRAHFFAVAAQVMRNLLVDHARARNRAKRGGNYTVNISEAMSLADPRADELLAINGALDDLARFDLRQSRIVQLRYFGGLSIPEIAAVLEISERTVKREWQMAKAWLCQQVQGGTQRDSI